MRKLTKRILALVLCGLLTFSAAPGSEWLGGVVQGLTLRASAAAYSGACGDDVRWRLDTETGVLTISGTGAMENYSIFWGDNPAPWMDDAYRSSVRSVTIENGVTAIGNWAFGGCSGLTSVTIGNGVTTIGDWAFAYCDSLTSVTIPDSVTTIGDWAFAYCNSLTSVTIPDSVTTIGDWAFAYCNSLTSVTIPDSVTMIGDWAFGGCSGLTSVTIPDSVTEIGEDAFNLVGNVIYSGTATGAPWGAYCVNGCYDGTFLFDSAEKKTLVWCRRDVKGEVVIPSGVTTIGDWAFAHCDSLTSVTIPDSVTTIGDCAFAHCDSLTSVTIPDSVTEIGEDAFYLIMNVIYSGTATGAPWGADFVNGCYDGTFLFDSAEKKTLVWCRSDIKGEVVIPPGVTMIGHWAFGGCSGLTSVTIPGSVTTICDSAFRDCDSLTSVTIPGSVTAIGDYAFAGCYSLTSVTIPGSVTAIGDYAFADCHGLTRVTIGNGVTTIGDDAFEFCTSLACVTIPDSVTTIGEYAFAKCVNLVCAVVRGGGTGMGTGAFADCLSLQSIVLPSGVTAVDCNAFSTGLVFNTGTMEYLQSEYDDAIASDAYAEPEVPLTLYKQIIDSMRAHPNGSLADVYFMGTEAEWNAIGIKEGNDTLQNAEIHCIGDLPAHTHAFVSTQVEPSCTADGARIRVCTLCGAYETESIPKTAHTPREVVRPASCAAEGRQFSKCGVCGKLLSALTVLPKTAHTYTAVVTKEPSCTAEGERVYTCTVCGYSQTDAVEALGHDFGAWQVTREPTATETGEQTRVCSRCGASETQTLDKPFASTTIAIRNYAAAQTVDYRTTITFEAAVENPISGAQVHWFIDGQDKGTGVTYTEQQARNSFTVQAKYVKDDAVLAESETETVHVKTGFFAKLKAFFRALFCRLPKIVQEYLGVPLIERILPG